MEALNNKRARLQRELQEAYSAWVVTSEFCASSRETHTPVDISGCSDTTKVKWFEYLAAKERLVLAYAEQPVAA